MGRPSRAPTSSTSSPVIPSSATSGPATTRPRPTGVVERFNQSLKYEHLYREEIATVIGLAEHIDAYRELYNWVRPHEAIGFLAPMARYLAEPVETAPASNLSEPEDVQVP